MDLNIAHSPAAHCENGTISSLLRYYNINLSEPMIFGLASGIFFVHLPFLKMSGMPVTSFRTFPGVLFKRVTKMLEIKTHTRRFFNPQKAMMELDNLLMVKKIPVGCVVGMYYLPYMPIEYRFHFNGHNICVAGKDEKSGDYIVLDSNALQKVTISPEDLQKVRFAKGGTYPLLGQMYWIESVPKDLPPLKPLILNSIKKTCKNMVCNPSFIKFVGTRGIRYMGERICNWEKSMGARRAQLNLAQVIRMLEEIGTGGAGFRFIYGAFLQEASSVENLDWLNSFSERITQIGDMWREFAYKSSRIYKRREGENYSYNDLGELLFQISEKEDSFFKDLYARVKEIS